MRLAAKLGFTEAERFEGFGTEQWFGVWFSGAADEEQGRRLRLLGQRGSRASGPARELELTSESGPDERDRIRAAMDRILAGTP